MFCINPNLPEFAFKLTIFLSMSMKIGNLFLVCQIWQFVLSLSRTGIVFVAKNSEFIRTIPVHIYSNYDLISSMPFVPRPTLKPTLKSSVGLCCNNRSMLNVGPLASLVQHVFCVASGGLGRREGLGPSLRFIALSILNH